VQISLGKPDEALKMLSAAQPGTFAARYAEVRGDALFAKGDKAGALAEFRKARDTQAVAGTATVDAAGLELKIADLEADGIGAASPQKAKP
jgi:predicted negative regulator of RcsB-dependent stress response